MSWKRAVMFFSEQGEEGKEYSTICAFAGEDHLDHSIQIQFCNRKDGADH
jgi:hypothetical protein